MDWIRLTDLRFDAIVGILASEQVAPQPLLLQLRMAVPLDLAGDTGDLSTSVDYAAVAQQARFIAQHGRWRLIESLGLAVARLVLAPPAPGEARAAVARVELSIDKPTILGELAVPGVQLGRDAAWASLSTVTLGAGVTAETLCATPLSAAYRVHLAPGASWSPPPGVALRGIAGTASSSSGALGPGGELARMAAPLTNRDDRPVSLLAVGAPFPTSDAGR